MSVSFLVQHCMVIWRKMDGGMACIVALRDTPEE